MLFSQFAPLLVYLQLFILLLPLFYAHNGTTQSVILIVLTLVCVCSDCSWLGFGFRFGVWVWFRARAWAPEKVLRHFSTVHCFVLLCRTGLLELRAGCLAASACPPGCVCICICVCVCICVYVTLTLFVGTENWFPVSAQSRLHRWLDFVPNSKHFGRVNIPRNYNIILWGSTG